MRPPHPFVFIALGLAFAALAQPAWSQPDRDFVFTDEHGHLMIRFAGATKLDPSQQYEVLNQEFSRMVHDRLHADVVFAGEARDPDWAALMEPQIAEHVKHAGLEFSDIFVQCRAASCRVILEQTVHWDLPGHRGVLETVQKSLDAFIASRREQFEPVFMITAYYQENETSHIKAFLRRTERAPETPPGG